MIFSIHLRYSLALLFLFFSTIIFSQIQDTTQAFPLRWEADDLAKKGKYHEALGKYLNAQQLFKKMEDWDSYTYCSRWIGNCYVSTSRYDQALEKYNDGLDVTREKLNNPPIKLIYLYGGLLQVAVSRNEFQNMVNLSDSILKIARPLVPHTDLFITTRLILKGHGYNGLSEYEKSIQCFQEAQKLEREAGRVSLEEMMESNLGLARVYREQFKYDKALSIFKKCEPFFVEENEENLTYKRLCGNFYNAYGLCLENIGDYDKALETYQKALSHNTNNLGAYHMEVMHNNNNLGSLYTNKEEHDLAISHYQNALLIADSIMDHPNQIFAEIHLNIGMIYHQQEKSQLAVETLETAIEESKQLPAKKFYWSTQISYGEVLMGNKQFAKANEVLEKTKKYYEALDEHHYQLSSVHEQLGRVALAEGKLELALEESQKSLKYRCIKGIPFDNWKNPSPEAFISLEGYYSTMNLKVNTLLQKSKKEEDSKQSLLAVIATCENALAAGDFFRKKNLSSLENNYDWIREGRDFNLQGMQAAALLFEKTSNKAFAEKALELADQSKSSNLLKNRINVDAKVLADLPDDILEKEKAFLDMISSKETQIQKATKANDLEQVANLKDKELFALKKDYELFVDKVESEYPDYYQLKYQNKSVDISELTSMLQPEELIVEYILDDLQQFIYILTINSTGEISIAKSPLPKNSSEQLSDFHQSMQSFYLTRKNKREQFINTSYSMYQSYIQPIEKQLVGKNKIIIIGEGPTNLIPFEVLVKSNKSLPFEQLDFLIKDFEIVYHYSATLFVKSQKEKLSTFSNNLLAFAPVFGEEGENKLLSTRGEGEANSISRTYDENGNFNPLYYSEKEVNDIEKLFSKMGQTQNKVFTYQTATETQLKNQFSKSYRYIHIASHSFANKNQPKFSGIACTNSPKVKATEDGILYVGEIYNQNISTDLLVLSSCESGVGKLIAGEGLLGLNRSFVYAGVPNVIFSLWKVNDKTSSTFMINFYKKMLTGQSYAAALRATKLEMIQHKKTASPNLWSGFLLLGR